MTKIIFFTLMHVLVSLKVLTAVEDICSRVDLPICKCETEEYRDEADIHIVCTGIKDEQTLRHILEKLQDIPLPGIELNELELPFLPRGLFKNVTLKQLAIQRSQNLTSLAPNSTYGESVFYGLEEELDYLEINNNPRLTTIQFRELRLLRKLRILRIANCPVDMSKGLRWLKRLPLEHVVIINTSTSDELENKAFTFMRKLTTFVLADHENFRKISRDLFPRPAEHLKDLVLCANAIEDIPIDMFDGMPQLLYVDISHNRILYFYESTFLPVWNHLRMLSMHNNPIHCDENIAWLVREIKSHSESSAEIDDNLLTCASPQKLKKRLIGSLQEMDLEMDNNL